jgi:hypothetical protein
MQYEEQGNGISLAVIFGAVLMFAGVVMAAFIGRELLALYDEPEANRMVAFVTAKLSETEVVSTTIPPGGAIKIGAGGALLAALAVVALLASIAGRIAGVLIRVGFQMSFGSAKSG